MSRLFQQHVTTENLLVLNPKILNCSDQFMHIRSHKFNWRYIDTNIQIHSSEQVKFSTKKDTPWYDGKCEEKRHYFLYYFNR